MVRGTRSTTTHPLAGGRGDAIAPVERLIAIVRGQRVILSADLAGIYGVETRALNQAVQRHLDRFPVDFAFRITRQEAETIRRPRSPSVTLKDTPGLRPVGSRSQSVILKRGANLKYAPLAFTEHGAVMVATVLNSPRAVQMSIFVVRAFLRLRGFAVDHAGLSAKLGELERRVAGHDKELQGILSALRQLLQPARDEPRPRIGFRPD